MQIQWYPGHMTKARRMMEENVKLIDVVIEVIDARAPRASRNTDFEAMFQTKKRIIVMNKSDLACQKATSAWISAYRAQGIFAVDFVSTVSKNRKKAIDIIEKSVADLVEKKRQKGMQMTVRAMVVGIPNVGKSTFINCLCGSAMTSVGNKPGVTKGKQWVKITPYLELMDTPGMLMPKLENQQEALHLAFLGSIRDEILNKEQLSIALLEKLAQIAGQDLCARYKKLDLSHSAEQLLSDVCTSRGFILPGGVQDFERATTTVLEELRAGKIGRITFERVNDQADNIE